MWRTLLLSAFLLLTSSVHSAPAASTNNWTTPFPAFRVIGNVYYVGSAGLASYLITTPQGHILVNSSLPASVPLIRKSIEQLGFKFADVKILLISHAHFDHDGGSALVKAQTHARYMVMDRDVSTVESGGRADFAYGGRPDMRYPPTKVDRVLKDGDQVRLGNTVMTAHLTAGHTKGCTTWTLDVVDGGRTYHVVIVGSININPGYKLVGNTKYPDIAKDYQRSIQTLKSLPCDVFLGAHGSYFNMEEKYRRIRAGAPNPFVDPAGYREFIEQGERALRQELAKQRERS